MRTERWWYHLRWGHVMGWGGAVFVFLALTFLSHQKISRAPAITEAPCPPALMPTDSLPPGLGVPMVGPLEGQKRPPCKGPRERGIREHELRGACWYRMEGEPPCGEGYENGGSCYAPVPARFRVPSTISPEGSP